MINATIANVTIANTIASAYIGVASTLTRRKISVE
jgi:hypothetical protein